ncbi:unnamed protein product [Lathyrus oleraceus]
MKVANRLVGEDDRCNGGADKRNSQVPEATVLALSFLAAGLAVRSLLLYL